jgi:adenylate kinase family enzyme
VDRIAIIGCGGSGKSHLARELGILLDIMPAHLDRLYYDRAWNPVEQQRFAALQRDLVSAPRWIIDGNYAATLPIRLEAADTVIFLDLPAWGCLWGVAQRRLRHGGGQHDAIGVYDRITWNFIRYIGGYRRHMAPRVRQLIRPTHRTSTWSSSAIAALSAATLPRWPRRCLLPARPLPMPIRRGTDFFAWHQAGPQQGCWPADRDRVETYDPAQTLDLTDDSDHGRKGVYADDEADDGQPEEPAVGHRGRDHCSSSTVARRISLASRKQHG